MRVLRLVLASLTGICLVAACATPPRAGKALLPRYGVKLGVTPERSDPWARLRALEAAWRDVPLNYSGGPRTVIQQLEYPLTRQQQFGWAYVSLGHDFLAAKEPAAASVAFWAALALAPRLLGSRPEKEQLRVAALRGLGAAGAGRRSPEWLALVGLSASLGEAYLRGPTAEPEGLEFHKRLGAVVSRYYEAERQRKAAESRAFWSTLGSAFLTTISAVGAKAQHYTDVKRNVSGADETLRRELAALNVQQQATLQRIEEQRSEGLAAAKENADAARYAVTDLEELTARDVASFSSGLRPFAARQAVGYLRRAKGLAPYLPALRAYAQGRPALEALLGRAPSSGDLGPWLAEVAAFLEALERESSSPPAGARAP